MWKYIILFAILATITNSFPNNILYSNSLSNVESLANQDDIHEDVYLNVTELIKKYGYPAETHELETEDGYLISMHRIPSGKVPDENAHKTPVLIMHGLLGSSADYVLNGPGKALGYILADAGYDVWMGNARGNFYSRKHVSLDPDNDDKFWKFSWNEIGLYDVPMMISHILETTGKEKLHYIGHSQGGTVFFVMASEIPEINDKILLMQGMAPGAYYEHTRSPIFTYLAPYVNTVEKLFELLGYNELFPSTELMQYIADNYCTDESPYQPACENFYFAIGGASPEQLNSTLLPVYMAHTPAGASSKQLIHYVQLHDSKKFRKYDFGEERNLELYGTSEPPDYNLTKITAPAAVHYGESDLFVHPLDIDRLYAELGNPIGKYKVPLETFNHVDFCYGIDAPTLVYDLVLNLMESYNPNLV